MCTLGRALPNADFAAKVSIAGWIRAGPEILRSPTVRPDVFGRRVKLGSSRVGGSIVIRRLWLFISVDRSMVTGNGFGTCLHNVAMFSLEVEGEHRQKAQPPRGEQQGTAWTALSSPAADRVAAGL